MMKSSLSSLTMSGADAFSNPFESAQRNGTSHNKNPSAIGSGRVRTGSANNRHDGTSPTAPGWNENHAIRMRKLPQTATRDTVHNMLVFAKDFTAVEMLPSLSEDKPYLTAMVRFKTPEGAMEAARALDGKRAGADSPEMIVELVPLTPDEKVNGGRWLPDAAASNGLPAHSSRYSETFKDMDRVSPSHSVNSARNHVDGGMVDGASPTFRDMHAVNGSTFAGQSPIGHPLERQHISGRSMIQADGADDETNQIMQDPGSWMSAASERQMQAMQQGRRATAPNISSLGSRMGSLSINSSVGPSLGGMHANGIASPRAQQGFQTPVGAPFSPPAMHGMNMYNNAFSNATSPTSSQYQPQSFRSQLPPVNPADQNPPCNTLYVGNLPMDTSEDELKQMFSKARGYRRLCFRMKGNGPMCFVEFEDISHATRALKDYYGLPLSNSVRGGIRLSFSKNPLGVRGNAQQSPISPINVHGGGPGGNGSMPFSVPNGNYGVMASSNFATASGPPPGLPTPQGFSAASRQRNSSVAGQNGTGLANPVGYNDASRAFNFYGR